jgi:hypothetical protein
MSMRDYPIQGVGVFVKNLDLKDNESFFEILDDIGCGEFYSEERPNGIMACIDISKAEGDNDNDEYCLITYNYKPYEQTPFDSLDELKQFYIRGLREHVNASDTEIYEMIDDIDSTGFG